MADSRQRRIWAARWCAVAVAAGACTSSGVQAQAWLPESGDVVLGIAYEAYDGGDLLANSDARDGENHLCGTFDGNRIGLGEIRSHSMLVEFDYGITTRLAVSVEGAAISARFDGCGARNPDIDDGRWHSSLQDVRLESRYQVWTHREFTLVPAASLASPMSDYSGKGHSAIGSAAKEGSLGVYLGYLKRSEHRPFVQLSAHHRWLERIEDSKLRIVNVGLSCGLQPSTFLGLSLLVDSQIARGGIDWFGQGDGVHDNPDRQVSGGQSNTRYLRMGGSIDWSLRPEVVVYISGVTTIWAENTTDSSQIRIGFSSRIFQRSATDDIWAE